MKRISIIEIEFNGGKLYNENGSCACVVRKERKMHRQKVTYSLTDDHGTWTVKARIYDTDGNCSQRSISTGFKVKDNTKRKAEAKAKEIVQELEKCTSNSAQTEAPQFSAYVKLWLEKKRKSLKGNTVKSYQDYAKVHIFPYFGELKISEVTYRVLQDYVDEKAKMLTSQSIQKHFVVIKGAILEAMRDGIIINDPSVCIEYPKEKKFEGSAYSAEQVKTLLDAAAEIGEPIHAAIMLAVCYGLRRSEVCGLRWLDVDFGANTLTVCNTVTQNGDLRIEEEQTKTKSGNRTIMLYPVTVNYLKELKAVQETAGLKGGKVVAWMNGEEVRPDYIYHKTKQIMEKCGLPPIRFHDLRHTAVSLLAPNVAPVQLKNFAGHGDINTTFRVYAHLLDKEKAATSVCMNTVLENAGISF